MPKFLGANSHIHYSHLWRFLSPISDMARQTTTLELLHLPQAWFSRFPAGQSPGARGWGGAVTTGNSALAVSWCCPTDHLILNVSFCWWFNPLRFPRLFGLWSRTTVWHIEEGFITSPENEKHLGERSFFLQPHGTPLLTYQKLLWENYTQYWKYFPWQCSLWEVGSGLLPAGDLM